MFKEAFKRSFPDQHGAWAVLISGLLVGTFGGGLPESGLLSFVFAVAAFMGFVFRYSAGAMLKEIRRTHSKVDLRRELAFLTVVYGLTAGGLGLYLIFGHKLYSLVPVAVIAGVFFLLTLVFEWNREHLTARGEFAGMFALSLVVPGAYIVARGGVFDTTGWMIWLVMMFFYTGSVFHVRYLVRERKFLKAPLQQRLRRGWISIFYHTLGLVVIAGASLYLSTTPLWTLAFVPPFIRAVMAVLLPKQEPPPLPKIGIQELVHTLFLCVIVFLWVHI